MNIKAYLKPSCGWSNGVRAILRKHNLALHPPLVWHTYGDRYEIR